MKREPRFEALWYDTADCRNNYYTECFYTLKSLQKFYMQHKDDTDKHNWWLTHRDADWYPVADIEYDETANKWRID